jgi:hypothetical protein
MSSLPSVSTLSKPYKRDAATRRVCDLLDTLIAIRIDVGHSANGVAASPTPGSEQIREVRALLDLAIASTKEIFGSVYRSQNSDQVGPSRHTRRVTLRRMAGVDQTPS